MPDRITLLLAARPKPGGAALDALRTRMAASFEEPLEFDIQLVDGIPEDGAKFKPFLSRL